MENTSEKFGNLPLDDLKDFTKLLEPLKNEQAELLSLTREKFDKLQSQLSPDFSWSLFYELPLLEFSILQLATFGSIDSLEQAHKDGKNLFRYMLDESIGYMQGAEAEWDGGHKGQFTMEDVYAVMFAMQGWMDSIRYYGRYINHMVADVRDGKDPEDKAFFDVLRIDPTAIGCPSFVARLSRAHLKGDTKFMNDLQLALVGKPHSSLSANENLRMVLQLMHEAESLEDIKTKEAQALFVRELKLYTTQGDSKRSLMRFIQRWLENQRGDMKSRI